jgi:hypothetical protein
MSKYNSISSQFKSDLPVPTDRVLSKKEQLAAVQRSAKIIYDMMEGLRMYVFSLYFDSFYLENIFLDLINVFLQLFKSSVDFFVCLQIEHIIFRYVTKYENNWFWFLHCFFRLCGKQQCSWPVKLKTIHARDRRFMNLQLNC